MGEVIENRSGKRVRGLKLYDVKAVARFLDVSERRVRQLREPDPVKFPLPSRKKI